MDGETANPAHRSDESPRPRGLGGNGYPIPVGQHPPVYCPRSGREGLRRGQRRGYQGSRRLSLVRGGMWTPHPGLPSAALRTRQHDSRSPPNGTRRRKRQQVRSDAAISQLTLPPLAAACATAWMFMRLPALRVLTGLRACPAEASDTTWSNSCRELQFRTSPAIIERWGPTTDDTPTKRVLDVLG